MSDQYCTKGSICQNGSKSMVSPELIRHCRFCRMLWHCSDEGASAYHSMSLRGEHLYITIYIHVGLEIGSSHVHMEFPQVNIRKV
jgi:hypothetical protein